MNKKLIALTGLLLPVAPIAAVVSCSSGNASKMLSKLDYDFGLACAPVNNLNFLRSNLGQAQDTIVFPLVEPGPKGTLKNILQLPELKLNEITVDNQTSEYVTTGTSYSLSTFGEYAGSISPAENSYLYLKQGDVLDSVIMRLNEKVNWKGAKDDKYNRVVTAQDYVDGMKYMMDLNNGSQLISRLLTTGIIGINELYNAQVEYVEKVGKTYSDPWGFNISEKGLDFTNKYSHLKSETADGHDMQYVAKIEEAARLLLSQGIKQNDVAVNGVTPDEFDLKLSFDPSLAPSEINFDSYYIKYLLPANREFIESIGGIYKFGASVETFQYISPFNITDIRLGQGGYINLEKDTSFYSAKYTLSNKIKIYFQEDPNILSSMFKDGFISSTTVASTYLEKFWSDPSLRGFMTKSQGFGTVALRFNLSKPGQTDANKATLLDNPDLRQAISYAIERNQYIKLAGWDSAAITTLWNVKGSQTTSDGRALDTFYENQVYKDVADIAKNDAEQIPLVSMNFNERAAILYRFEHATRNDARHNSERAVAHLDKYLKDSNKQSVSLTFLTNGDQGVKQGLGIKSQFEKIFGDKLKIEIKSVPKTSYDNMITHGEFDMSVDNFDKFGMSAASYYKALTWADEIDPDIRKTSGFLNNPTGSWTFGRFYDRIVKQNLVNEYQVALGLKAKVTDDINNVTNADPVIAAKLKDNKEIWDAFVNFATHSLTFNTINQAYIDNIFAGEADISTKLYVLFEKIIALDAPVVPLYEVDTKWDISRLVGVQNLAFFDLQFAYDATKRPGENYPGVEQK